MAISQCQYGLFNYQFSLSFWSGLSLKTQELTAMFLALRLVCSIIMEADIHTVLDFATLASTAWVIYMIRFKLKSTYIKELDNFPIYYIVCALFYCHIMIHLSKFCLKTVQRISLGKKVSNNMSFSLSFVSLCSRCESISWLCVKQTKATDAKEPILCL